MISEANTWCNTPASFWFFIGGFAAVHRETTILKLPFAQLNKLGGYFEGST